MNDMRVSHRRASAPPKDLEILVHALREALSVIDDHDPDRNPSRCMRHIRRLLDNSDLRFAVTRLGAEIPMAE
jgi:hypothetical protein